MVPGRKNSGFRQGLKGLSSILGAYLSPSLATLLAGKGCNISIAKRHCCSIWPDIVQDAVRLPEQLWIYQDCAPSSHYFIPKYLKLWSEKIPIAAQVAINRCSMLLYLCLGHSTVDFCRVRKLDSRLWLRYLMEYRVYQNRSYGKSCAASVVTKSTGGNGDVEYLECIRRTAWQLKAK